MKKNQERRLHRKNAKIVKEGGTPMQLDRPVKPDTTARHPIYTSANRQLMSTSQRRCGHCGQMGHMSTFVHRSNMFSVCFFLMCHMFDRNQPQVPSLGRVQLWQSRSGNSGSSSSDAGFEQSTCNFAYARIQQRFRQLVFTWCLACQRRTSTAQRSVSSWSVATCYEPTHDCYGSRCGRRR